MMFPLKKAVVSVINDLVTDQRVHKTCMTLHNMGFDVHLVGRTMHSSLPLESRAYTTYRMNLFFEKGICFYFFFSIEIILFSAKKQSRHLRFQ